MSSPTARSLKLLRAAGYLCAIVEQWLAHAGVKRDLYGFADLLCVQPGRPMLLVQTTSKSNQAARIAKVRAATGAAVWLKAGGAVEVHGWEKRDGRWHCHRVEVLADTLEPIDLTPRPRPKRKRKGERQGNLFEQTPGEGSG